MTGRRQLLVQQPAGFAPVRIAPDAASAGVAGPGMIENEFATGRGLRVTGAVDAAVRRRRLRCWRRSAAMIPVASGVRVWIATGHTDMRRGMNTLALAGPGSAHRDPHGGDLYVFAARAAS